MELTESKVKSLLNEQVINELDCDTFNQILNTAVTQACGKSDTTGI